MNSVRTLRGRLISPTEVRRIIVDDGMPNHGYEVVKFDVWCDPLAADGVFATLGVKSDMLPGARADDNRQIAWAGNAWASSSSNPATGSFSVVDPDHVVITDLFIRSATNEGTNYMIQVRPITLSDDQAILALIKERAQDDLR